MKKVIIQVLIVSLLSLFVIFIYQRVFKDKEINYTEDSSIINQENNMENQITELQIEILQEGTGEGAVNGNTVTVHYTGTLLDGTKFDSSVDKDTPFSFELGAGQVIQGWEQGILGMKVGEKRKLTIPSDLAYGEYGAGSIIGPNEPLIFEVEMLEIN